MIEAPSRTGDAIRDSLWSISRTMSGSFRGALRASRLTPPQFWILQNVESSGSLGATELSRRLCVRPPTLSGFLDRLVDDGLVARTVSPSDRRQVRIALTSQGSRALGRARTSLEGIWAERLAAVPERRRRAIGRALRDLERYLAVSADVSRPPRRPASPGRARRRPSL
ncbi:MAG TPA: MarR family transcriptional regulator [Thermoplasmata archaeon]|nr:MarR family transcriptional regulator [Thermoplasmata archaeon]HUJ77741.1 MarR family transcriptional regulator [Thermoplasmata archaeon]